MAGQRAEQSNSFSTGGGGVIFEVYVQTYFAMHIVTGDHLPFLSSSKPVKMKLQGHYDGYNTDDCIVFGEKGEKVLCQIKHSITVSEKDSIFHSVITDAWNDYCNTDMFNQNTDEIILIVASLRKIDIDHTRILFEWARSCENAEEFIRKITTDKFSSTDKQKKYNAIKNQLESVNGGSISDFVIWDFFRHFNIQVLELDYTKSPLFTAVSNSFSRAVGRRGSEDLLYRYIAGYNKNAGTITRELLLKDINIEINRCDKRDFELINEKNDIKRKTEHKKKNVLRQLLFPWFKQSPKYKDVFPELFIDPRFLIEGENFEVTDVTTYFDKNLMILGDAGAGKSTFLRTWFVFKDKEKGNGRVKDVLLFDAKEYLIEESFFNDMIKYLRHDNGDHYLLLIDAIDEAFYNDYPKYKTFNLQLQELENCSIWMGCRKDYYKMYSGGDGMNISDYDFLIQEWNAHEIEEFILRYADIRDNPDIPKRVEAMKNMGDKGIIEALMHNPFQLSIIVFLAEDPEEIHIKGRYDLYERFMTKWNKHEILRGTSKYSEEEKEATLFEAALCVYCNKIYIFNDCAENDTGVNALLREPDVELKWGDGHTVANEFYHRSLAEFILAKITFKSMLNMKNNGYEETFRRICKTKMKDDVTNFILDKFLTISVEDKYTIKTNLQELYETLPEQDDTLSLREQIIYYMTRLDIDVSDFTGKIIDSNPKNNMIRLSLAYGCTLLRDKKSREYALNFAKAIVDNPNGEEAITNRAWAVIFYGDFHGEEKGIDEYSYRDEEKGPWKKVRENRVQRFEREIPRWKDLRFWVLDIPLFHNFLIDRGWNDINDEEYGILAKLQFSSEAFDDEEKRFLIEEHDKLLSEYYYQLHNAG